mgnify:FL=1
MLLFKFVILTNIQEIEPVVPESGSGTYIYPDGARYEGEWQMFDSQSEDPDAPKKIIKRHGQGKFIESDGQQWYEGNWSADAMDGQGAMNFRSGCRYDGDWQANSYHGSGKYTFPDGTFYEGQMHNNMIHGEGVYVDSTGRPWKGTFYNNSGPGLTEALKR